MTQISPFLLGGILIGVSATLFLAFSGRIAGISGIFHGLFHSKPQDRYWRLAFIAGLLGGGLLYRLIFGNTLSEESLHPISMIIGGLLVGIGTKMGSGCTSGHGVCGIGRLSRRSIIATLVFFASAMITVYIIQFVSGASS